MFRTKRSTLERRKPDALAAVEHQPAAHQSQLAPTRDGLGRDVELAGQFFDREDLLAHGVGRQFGGVGQIFHQQAEIVDQIATGDLAAESAGAVVGAGQMLEAPGRLIGLADVDAGDQPLGGVDALQQLLASRLLALAIADFADAAGFYSRYAWYTFFSVIPQTASTWCSLRFLRPRR